MGKAKVKNFKINVTGMTEEQVDHVKKKAEKLGTNKATYMKMLVNKDME